jgi:predicted ester cyclase
MRTFGVTFVTVLLSVPTLVMAEDAETQQRNREALIECLKQEDTSKCWAEGQVLNHGVKVPRERIQAILEDIRRTFPDGTTEIVDRVFDGDTMVTRSVFRGTHTGMGRLPINGGMLVGVPPTGKRVEYQSIHWYKLRDGKIIEHYAARDDLGMMRQLGLLPPPQAPAAED